MSSIAENPPTSLPTDGKRIRLESRIKELEEELSKVKEQYEHLFKNAPSGVYEIDFIEQKFISCNEELLLLTGYTKEEFLSLSPLEILSEDSRIRFLERLQNLFAGEGVEEEPIYLVKTKNGRNFWAKLNPTYIYDKDRLVGAQVIVHDISAMKKVEEEIQFTRNKFHSLFNNAQELISVIQDGEIKIINNKAMHNRESTRYIDFVISTS
jgi:PAS domain S-box-containing protein